MALVRFNQNSPSFFDRFLDEDLFDFGHRDSNTTLPSVNVKENDNSFLLDVAVPGYDKKDFNVEVKNNILTISSEKKEETEEKKEEYTKREFCYKSFSRSFTLPNTADGDKVSAKYEKGILHVEIPKKEEAKPKEPKKIEIQ